jgi:hypothetical protein
VRPILLLPAAACLALAGCGAGSSLPPATDPAQGREALKTVLETWKRGGTIDELKTASRPITVRDPDWSAGAKLAGYEIAPEDERAGADLLLTVKLVLARPNEPPREKKVGFKVAIGSSTVVLRNE